MAIGPTPAPTPLSAALAAGLDTLDYNQSITFTLYQRKVLPLDGYVFWIRADLITPPITNIPLTLTVKGALHYTTDARQELDQNYVSNRVIFSAQSPVKDFQEVEPDQLYLGEFEGVRFSFASRGSYFQQAALHHYVGTDLTATMLTQIIDDPDDLPPDSELIVSNSLPSWLAINSYAHAPWPDNPPFPTNPPYPVDIPFPDVPLFPSFLSPYNMETPFGTIHVEPDQTTAFQVVPSYDPTLSSEQLCHDRVTITLYGCTNAMAQDFLAALYQYTLDTGRFGIIGTPAVLRDDKQFAVEYLTLAQKKRIIVEVAYIQRAQRDIARQLIEEVIVHVIGVDDFIADVPTP